MCKFTQSLSCTILQETDHASRLHKFMHSLLSPKTFHSPWTRSRGRTPLTKPLEHSFLVVHSNQILVPKLKPLNILWKISGQIHSGRTSICTQNTEVFIWCGEKKFPLKERCSFQIRHSYQSWQRINTCSCQLAGLLSVPPLAASVGSPPNPTCVTPKLEPLTRFSNVRFLACGSPVLPPLPVTSMGSARLTPLPITPRWVTVAFTEEDFPTSVGASKPDWTIGVASTEDDGLKPLLCLVSPTDWLLEPPSLAVTPVTAETSCFMLATASGFAACNASIKEGADAISLSSSAWRQLYIRTFSFIMPE